MSLLTAPLGFSQTHFVPRYWAPPTVFDLARTTGFDIESVVFCFAVGGVGPILYKLLVPAGGAEAGDGRGYALRYRCRHLAAASPVATFVALELSTSWNPVYTASLGMFTGTLVSLLCRPDLKVRVWLGGGAFLVLYFTLLKLFDVAFPGYIQQVWTLSGLSGVLLWGVPMEECLFALSFGMMWSCLYELLFWPKALGALEPESVRGREFFVYCGGGGGAGHLPAIPGGRSIFGVGQGLDDGRLTDRAAEPCLRD